MNRLLFALALWLAVIAPAAADDIAARFAGHAGEQTLKMDYGVYAGMLAKHVAEAPDGLDTFDYAAVGAVERQSLKRHIDTMAAIDPLTLTRDQKFAYWANLYNALTLDIVLDSWPVNSIRDIRPDEVPRRIGSVGFFEGLSAAVTGGPWKARVVEVNGVALSLDDIEHRILRPMGDNRVHYAVNCASVGCPDLGAEPWRAERLDADLDRAAAQYVNHPRGVRRRADGGLVVSSIYDWFEEDFGGSEAGVLQHLRRHADAGTKALLDGAEGIEGYEYDWAVNAPGARGEGR
ncbi:MAG: hypothetical protein TEF_06370 [Rhizobiales bacterium NRL2]|jgi:hypothetical protein|nr:MAG: hypothetical protein TEF_06370 [Rhizobiales bacterium NRL2]